MTTERENINTTHQLTPRDYDIAGNVITAYYDAAGKLVFVLDRTINSDKPNVLLVINPVGNRKWDDILANDYNIDLEMVRPKKDNKYQKLDIEYAGLGRYDDLIAAYDAGRDISDARMALDAFRHESIRRAATERLATANETSDRARETIERTNETIQDLTERVRQLRSKLATQRRDVGREPTKQSAAKILRTEAQIDSTNEKLRRAKKRLSNAMHRLAAAEEDADMARAILARLPMGNNDVTESNSDTSRAVTTPAVTDVAPIFNEIPIDDINTDGTDDIIDDPDDTDDAVIARAQDGDAVAPLFDQDPQILDEKIAFRPIDFDAPSVPVDASEPAPIVPVFDQVPMFNEAQDLVTDVEQLRSDEPKLIADEPDITGIEQDIPSVVPLSFTPPTATESSHDDKALADDRDDVLNIVPIVPDAPVLDSIMPIVDQSEPVSDTPAMIDTSADAMPEIAPAPAADAAVRPVSPLTGTAGVNAETVQRGRPTLVYYILLGLLIILSIFTLWLYQRNVGTSTPDLVTVSGDVTAGLDNDAPMPAVVDDTNPFIMAAPVTVESAPVVTPDIPAAVVDIVAQDAMPVTMPDVTPSSPTPADVPETPVSMPVPTQPVADMNSGPEMPAVEPVITDTMVAEPVIVESSDTETITPEPAAIPMGKPEYDVSRDKTIVPPVSSMPTCDDGSTPDIHGCCTGEEFTDMGDGGFACCIDDACYPPMTL